jgi:TRAP-type C4-dicarboxylate transport system permease small subunit
MSWRSRVILALRRLCHTLAGAALIAMLGITGYDVITRKLFGMAMVGIVDIIAFCVMWATMLGIALAWSHRAHIVVDILDMTGRPELTRALDVLSRVVGIVVMPLLMWLAWHETRDVYGFGDTTPEIQIPIYLYWLAAIVGYGLSTVFLLLDEPMEPRHA